MRTLKTLAVIALTLCIVQSAEALTLGGGLSGSGWLPQGLRPVQTWTKAEHSQAQEDAIFNANELLDLHVALQMWDFPKQKYADHIILEDQLGYYPDSPAHYTYEIFSYLIVFDSGDFVVIYP